MKMHRIAVVQRGLTAAAVLAALAVPVQAQTTFHINDVKGYNVVRVDSKAPLMAIETRTSQVFGEVTTDPADITKTTAKFELNAESLDTGMPSRDQVMHVQYIHSVLYPKIAFTLEKVTKATPTALAEQQPAEIEFSGTLNMHGVSKPITGKGRVTYVKESEASKSLFKGDLLRIESQFTIKLSEFGIQIPALSIMTVSNEQNVTLDVTGSTGTPSYFNPPEAK